VYARCGLCVFVLRKWIALLWWQATRRRTAQRRSLAYQLCRVDVYIASDRLLSSPLVQSLRTLPVTAMPAATVSHGTWGSSSPWPKT